VPWPLWVYRGPPEVYRGPCMKITRLKTPIIFTIANATFVHTPRLSPKVGDVFLELDR